MNVYPLKCRISAAAEATRVDVYDDIGEGGWFTEGLTAKGFAAQLSGVKGALEVHINSGGGDVFDGIAIGNAIRAHKGPVTTVVDGLAASIASVIAQAGTERVVQPGSMMMIHDAYGACMGDAAEMEKMAQTLDEVSANLAGIYAERSGKSAEGWRAAMRGETWFTAQEAVECGLADRVGDGRAELPAGLDVAAWNAPGRIAAALRSLPRSAAPGAEPAALTEDRIRAILREELAELFNWDGPAAMSKAANSDDPAAAYKAICAGRREGDPDKQSSWALPHHPEPGAAPDPDGVRNALARLPQTEGLTNASEAKAHLQAHLRALGGEPDGDDTSNHAARMPAWLTEALTAKEAASR